MIMMIISYKKEKQLFKITIPTVLLLLVVILIIVILEVSLR